MRSQLFIFLFTAYFLPSIAAQSLSTYTVYPNPSDTVTAPDITLATAFTEIKNLSSDSIFVKWVRTIIYLSPNVSSAVCDPDQCWFLTTQTNTFGLAGDSVGKIYVSFGHPENEVSSGIVHLYLNNVDQITDTLTAIYSFNTLSGTSNLPDAYVKLFPNPTTDYFRLENAEEAAIMRLYTLDGREVARFEKKADNTYSIANQPVGNYVLSFEDKNGQLFQAVEIHKR